MNGCWALMRLIYARNRFALSLVGSVWCIGMLTAWGLHAIFPDASGFIYLLSSIPALVWAFAAFEVDTKVDILSGESCYSHWLLRLPLASWQLSLVPNVLRVLMIGGMWIFAATIFHYYSGRKLPLAIPAMAFSSVAVWISAIAWRPVRYGWLRIAWGPVFLFGLWAAFIVTVIAIEPRHLAWWRPLILATAPIMLAWGFWSAHRSVVKARYACKGMISPESGGSLRWRRLLDKLMYSKDRVRHHPSGPVALAWHDLMAGRARMLLMWGISMTIALILALTANVPVAVVLAMIMMLGFFASVTTQSLVEPGAANGRTLTPYLIAAPMRTATLAWTRAATIATLCSAMSASLLIPGGIAFLRAATQNSYARWSDQMTLLYQSDWAAVRISIAVLLLMILFTAGRSINSLWAILSGNSRLSMYVGVVGPLWVFAPMLVLPGWVIQQPNWETAIANAWWWAAWVPWVACGLVLSKLLASVLSLTVLCRSGLESHANILKIVAAWIAGWIAIALLVAALIPDDRVKTWWCFALVALIMPFARLLILPVSVASDRHR